MEKILVIRLSAFGDVAISVPVINQFLENYPDKEIVFLTKKNFIDLFPKSDRLSFFTPDLKEYNGFFGIYRLFKLIKKEFQIDKVVDIHNVLRSLLLRFFFRLSGVKAYKIDKGRVEKRNLTKERNKDIRQLKHSSQRYYEVFEKAGFKFDFHQNINKHSKKLTSEVSDFLDLKKINIGIAPFALHKQKTYPIEKMCEVIKMLDSRDYRIIIFGGGKKEKEFAENLQNEHKNVKSIIGKYNLKTELDIISNLDLMLSMDSSNMHLAALQGTKVVSIWGATHPFAGFYPIGQNDFDNYIQISENELSCRPCSVFGNKECKRNDLACLNNISPKTIVDKIIENI